MKIAVQLRKRRVHPRRCRDKGRDICGKLFLPKLYALHASGKVSDEPGKVSDELITVLLPAFHAFEEGVQVLFSLVPVGIPVTVHGVLHLVPTR